MAYYSDAFIVNVKTCLNRAIAMKAVRSTIEATYLIEKCNDCNHPVPDMCTLNSWLAIVNSWNNSTPDNNTLTEMNFKILIAQVVLILGCSQVNINILAATITASASTVTEGTAVTFASSITGGTAPFTHQWQKSTDNGNTWTNITGATNSTYVISSPVVASTARYRDLVIDALSASVPSNNILLTVNAAANQAPVANAGADATITLPISVAALAGTGTDADGTVASYLWSKVSGPAGGTITAPTAATTEATALQEGTYVYRLTVIDNSGATNEDTKTITVSPAVTAINVEYGYNFDDPYTDNTTAPSVNNAATIAITHNADLSLTYPSAAVGRFIVVKVPAAESLKTQWFADNSIQQGTFGDAAWRVPFVVSGFRYYVTRDAAGFGFDSTFPIQLKQ